jgi:hypothetical protein
MDHSPFALPFDLTIFEVASATLTDELHSPLGLMTRRIYILFLYWIQFPTASSAGDFSFLPQLLRNPRKIMKHRINTGKKNIFFMKQS